MWNTQTQIINKIECGMQKKTQKKTNPNEKFQIVIIYQ